MVSDNRKRKEYSEIFSDYYPIIYNTIFTKVGDENDTKDICQEIFYRFYVKFSEVSNVRRWLFTAGKMVLMEFYRERNKWGADIDGSFDDFGLTFVNGFRDTRLIIKEAIEDISIFKNEQHKTLFDLIAVYNYSYSQVGKQLGLSKRQVEYQYTQIVERVIRFLNEKGIHNIEDLL